MGPFQWRPFADSAPIMEHSLAQQAGLGFIGKHTLLIHPKAGSTFFLGELLCNLLLPTDEATDHCGCGPCTSCIDICPTQAIVAPFTVDARRCISYLTIEYDGVIDESLRPLMGNRIYGCDDCQLACPWNRFAKIAADADFRARHGLDAPSLIELFGWDEATFLVRTEGMAIRRIGWQRWLRNIAVALGNLVRSQPGHSAAVLALKARQGQVSEQLDRHIAWALTQAALAQKI
ncbi:MAG: tRNA epoxyqueuosine(34) reductase QueG [Halothiobacillus sp. 20-54-6]|nr:MAG: tRNA epoxyqueuosine(34) reductase QueG [Halothiobacillus sp. 20-54-6]